MSRKRLTKAKRRTPKPRSKIRRSKFELKVEELLAKRTDLKSEYEKERLNYTLDLIYTPDWSVEYDGRKLPAVRNSGDAPIILEAKGLFDYIDRRKMLAVKRKNPERDIRMVFMRNNKIAKNSKMTYVDWCRKHEIPCSVYPELPL